jgi:hypothetical protein
MALRAVPDHPKFANLKSMLGLPKGAALGWLEALWHFTGRFTPQGNIGKYTDQAIEAWVEWDGAPGTLIAAFVKTGWINVDDHKRLIAWQWGYWSGLTKRGRRSAAIRAAGGEASKALRSRVLSRDGHKCLECGSLHMLTLDHIFPVSKGGRTEENNLQTLCRGCNSAKKDTVRQ